MPIAGSEWIVVGIVVLLLFFGGGKIAEFSRNLGRAKGEFKKGKMEVEKELEEEKKTE